jgi:hypothetical protein
MLWAGFYWFKNGISYTIKLEIPIWLMQDVRFPQALQEKTFQHFVNRYLFRDDLSAKPFHYASEASPQTDEWRREQSSCLRLSDAGFWMLDTG